MKIRNVLFSGLAFMSVISLISWLYLTVHNDKRNKYFCFAQNRYLTIKEVKETAMEYWLRSRNPDELRDYIVENYSEEEGILKAGKINYADLASAFIMDHPDCCNVSLGRYDFNIKVKENEYLSFKKPLAARLYLKKLFGVQDNHWKKPRLSFFNNTWGAAFRGSLYSAPLLDNDGGINYTRMTFSVLSCGNDIGMANPKTKLRIKPFKEALQ